MSDSVLRFRRIEGLDNTRLKGVRARQQLEAIEAELAAQQERYIKELIAKTRTNGAVYEAAVWKMVGISDIVQKLYSEAAKGDRAAAILHDMSQEAGGGE